MLKDMPIDPFEGIKQIGEMWEKQLNGLLYMMTDNKEFVRAANIGVEAHSRSMELLKKNQELLAKMLNIPTKTDVAAVAEMTIQTEGKMDGLEEQVWNLQDQIKTLKKENLEIFQEILQNMKQLKSEVNTILNEVKEPKKINSDFPEIRQVSIEMKIMQVHMQELKKELEELKEAQDIKKTKNLREIEMLQPELEDIKKGLSTITDLKKEITSLKNMLKKDKEKELVATK